MASYEYKVTTEGKSGAAMRIMPSALDNVAADAWTHATAIRYAHVRGQYLPAGTVIRVERRRATKRGEGIWRAHRSYVVGEDGIVRRTDR